MIAPQKWILKRPGIIIPVFFLSLVTVSGQISWQGTYVNSLGDTFVTQQGYCSTIHNQAGLGYIERHSISLQHSRPFIMNDLGISSLCAQSRTEGGALGISFSTHGITGLRYTSAWISYGMSLHHGITAGIGLHFWNSSITEQMLYKPGISCAMGIQAKINDRLVIGAHLFHPVGWYTDIPEIRSGQLIISSGCSYTFFKMVTYYCDLQFMSEYRIKSCHGLKLKFKEQLEILFGMHNRPFSISGGITIFHTNWILQAAFEYMMDSGHIPSSSLSYAW